MQDRIIDFVVSNSNISYDKFKQLMLTTDEIANDVGSILFAKKAVEYGLINEMGGLKDALEKMYELIEKERENKKLQTGNLPLRFREHMTEFEK